LEFQKSNVFAAAFRDAKRSAAPGRRETFVLKGFRMHVRNWRYYPRFVVPSQRGRATPRRRGTGAELF